MSRKDRIDLYISAVTLILGFFVVFEYFSDRTAERQFERRQAATLMIREYSSGHIRDGRIALFELWRADPEILASHRDRGFVTNRELAGFFRIVLHDEERSDSKILRQALFSISNHFDSVYFCIESETCDEMIIRGFYCKKSVDYHRIYEDLFESLNSMISGNEFGKSLRHFAQTC